MTINILFVSGIRSDYDLLYPLASAMQGTGEYNVGFHLCYPHFSETHNYSFNLVIEDGFNVLNLKHMKEFSFFTDENSRVETIGKTVIDINNTIQTFCPKLVIYLGDREEPLAAATVAAYNNIPTLHIAGGDNCFPQGGDVDEAVRHAISKLSSLHLVMAEAHKTRLIKMGECGDRVKFVGNPGIDRIVATPYLNKSKLTSLPKWVSDDDYVILIYHVMSSMPYDDACKEFTNILEVLNEKNLNILIGAPNSDPGQDLITAQAKKYIELNPDNSYFYKNLQRDQFINMLRHAEFIIGNSSLGILEANFLKKPTINVGERQRGRIHGKNVIFSGSTKTEIIKAIDTISSKNFIDELNSSDHHVYGDGNMVTKSLEFIEENITRTDLVEKHITY